MKTPSLSAWSLLLGMVFVESFSTLMLKESDGFRFVLPAAVALCGYLLVLYLFSYVLNSIPASVAYAVWTGLGTLLVVCAGWIFFGEVLTTTSLVGVASIVFGVIMINRKKSRKI